MHKTRIMAGCLAGLLVWACFSVIALNSGNAGEGKGGEQMCVPLGSLSIEPPESVKSRRSPVDFPHSQHFGFACQRCHHTWKGDAEITGCMTSGCHDLAESPRKPGAAVDPKLAARYYKSAYHDQCIGCHKEMKKKNLEMEMSYKEIQGKIVKTGPTGCVGCHPRES